MPMPFPVPLLLAAPVIYLAGALIPEQLFRDTERRWAFSGAVAGIPLILSALAAVAVAAGGAAVGTVQLHTPLGGLALSVRLDALTAVILPLITGIGFVILRFSRRYLDGEYGASRYLRYFLAALACVSLLVVTNDLLVLTLAWTGSSLMLHQLLGFYGERAAALIAAHKKFLLSRAADVLIFSAVMLIWRSMGTLRIDELQNQIWKFRAVPPALQTAGFLLAAGAVIRSAQLPFHGWLIQVMEAPTPVSAFLHAGIVNISGFVMIRLAGLVGHLVAGQTLLVVVGTITAVLASLTTTTRVSVKVALAWSTCAQMGFMLIECGLGAYDLALLHLVAHSIYKAHAFLSCGRVVEQQQLLRGALPSSRVTASQWALGATLSAILTTAVGGALGFGAGDRPAAAGAMLIFALALAPLFARALSAGAAATLRKAGFAIVLVAAYAAAHAVFGKMAPNIDHGTSTALLTFFVAVAFVALYAAQASIESHPDGLFARRLYPWFFAGFYLDELVTRLTFQLWPPRELPVKKVVAATTLGAAVSEVAA